MTLLYALAAVLVLVGLAGIVLPALPGVSLVFAGMLLAAWVYAGTVLSEQARRLITV